MDFSGYEERDYSDELQITECGLTAVMANSLGLCGKMLVLTNLAVAMTPVEGELFDEAATRTWLASLVEAVVLTAKGNTRRLAEEDGARSKHNAN